MKELINWIKHLFGSDVIRYLFFGGCTTMVNMVSYYILRKINVEMNIANITSIILAIIFAYIVNSRYVFQQKYDELKVHIEAFMKFISARAVTLIIEVAGLWFLVEFIKFHELFGKLIIQVIIIVLNYLFSKLFVFKSE